jgi:very-short-patch-repair endonuclease
MPAPSTLPLPDRIAAAIDLWKRNLLDLSKRNRALNFKPAKVSTVTVVDEQPAEAFRHLYLRERAMRFKAAPEEEPDRAETLPPAPTGTAQGAVALEEFEEDDGSLEVEFAPYDPAALDERHTDEWLQTTSTPEALDRSLRRIDEQARLTLEEQGVNTLFLTLGMLNYVEAVDSEQTFRAPLVLLPVELSRKSARSGYVLHAAEDEPLVNPALVEYLRRDFGIGLPQLPDSNVIPDDYDLQSFLRAVGDSIAAKKGWAVKTDIYLGLLSFQKLVMYKDLEANNDTLKSHRLIRQLVTRTAEGSVVALGLPSEIQAMDLDKEYPPEHTYQVVDADSSQLRAIATVARNHDVVIEGPPGTGKSQTITNLIAQALSVGKSVLFVAEKMAALSVVHERLVRANLGEFCLELHSTKASKRLVMKELSAALDASLKRVVPPTASAQRLPQVRAVLAEYARAVHAPYAALGLSPYQVYGRLGQVLGAPRVKYGGPVEEVTGEQLDQTIRDLQDLAVASTMIGNPAEHPWRESSKTFLLEDDVERVRELASSLLAAVRDVEQRASVVCAGFDLPVIETFADVETAAAIAEVMARSPGAPLSVLENPAWNEAPAEATALVERGRELNQLRSRAETHFKADVFEQEHAADIAYVEKKSEGLFSFLALLDARYRAIRRRWMSYRRASYQEDLAQQATEMRHVDRYAAGLQALVGMQARGRELFGGLWQGESSNWEVLENYIRWVVEFRGLCVRQGLSRRAIERATTVTPDVSEIEVLRAATEKAMGFLKLLREAAGWPPDYLGSAPLAEVAVRADALCTGAATGPRWAAFEGARRAAAESLAEESIPLAMSGELAFRDLAPAFLRAFYMKWLASAVQSRPALERFNTLTHEERVAEFRLLDERVLLENRAALVGQLRDRVQNALQTEPAKDQMPYLRRELAKQRALRPLRRTMLEAGAAIRAIKPCFMMSPLTVSQLLAGSAPPFDLVIFDEASQLPPEDAVGAVMRCTQLVVVGDPKQLPPTNFFSVTSGTANLIFDAEGQPVLDDGESILEEYMGAGVPMSRLKWHYRSAHESLISFSNVQFYEADLYTFPSVETESQTYGVQFEYVVEGVYEGKGLNAVEARRVADEVVLFAKEQIDRRTRGERIQSLGVGTFNLRQQLAIQDELEQRRRNDPSLEPFFDRGVNEPFFVKNLENIQGDERDVIFISVTYARGADGRLRYSFGPLNSENGWRRLNVLITRARHRMKVFSSMQGAEINAAATTSRGAKLLREFLLFAQHGRLESVSASLAADTDSNLERDVLMELTNRGVKVVPQIGVAGYRIDLGVLDDELPGRFLCGIECDGAAYHASETARDRDRLRQEVLEARGWTIHRLWSTDWFKDRAGQIDRLLRLIEKTRVHAREELQAEREARERAAAEAARRASEDAELARRAAAALAASVSKQRPYQRPVAEPYQAARFDARHLAGDILAAPQGQLVTAVVTVVEAEAPLHETDLYSRVAAMWGTKAGSRIQARIEDACGAALRRGLLGRRGEFLWGASETCRIRSRAGTRIPANRIAPEEYQAAVLAVLSGGHGFSRPELTNEVRSVFGFNRTGAALDEAINSAIDALMTTGEIGEASTGIRLRPTPELPDGDRSRS